MSSSLLMEHPQPRDAPVLEHTECLPDQETVQQQLVSIVAQCWEFAWSAWELLEGSWRGTTVPAIGGLYRIRLVLHVREKTVPMIVYIGQSRNLRDRLSMFADVFRHNGMPFKSPHVAGPFPSFVFLQKYSLSLCLNETV